MRLSSGTTVTATTDDNPVTAISAGLTGETLHNLMVVSTVNVGGYVSIDGGSTWHYFEPNAYTRRFVWSGIEFHEDDTVMVKRIAGGSDVNVYVSLW